MCDLADKLKETTRLARQADGAIKGEESQRDEEKDVKEAGKLIERLPILLEKAAAKGKNELHIMRLYTGLHIRVSTLGPESIRVEAKEEALGAGALIVFKWLQSQGLEVFITNRHSYFSMDASW